MTKLRIDFEFDNGPAALTTCSVKCNELKEYDKALIAWGSSWTDAAQKALAQVMEKYIVEFLGNKIKLKTEEIDFTEEE